MSLRATYLSMLALSAAACSPVPTAVDGAARPTQLSFTGRAPSAIPAVAPSRAQADTLRIGFDVLIVTRVQVAIRQVVIGSGSSVDCAAAPSDEQCRVLVSRSQLVDLPLGAGAEQRLSLDVPTGAYSQLALEVVPSAELDGRSIRIEGYYNGTPFTYETDLEMKRAMLLPRILEVGRQQGFATNMTVSAPVTSWFRSASTGALVNPQLLVRGSARDAAMRANITASLSAFEDRDRDGMADK
jgi:hypothetical protein